MWSETVSAINLQTLKSVLKSVQKCAIFTFKIQKFLGKDTFKILKFTPPQTLLPLCPLNMPPLANTSGSNTAVIPCTSLSSDRVDY